MNNNILVNVPPNKNYIYVNIWNMLCQPCIDEIPILELVSTKINSNICCIMVSPHSNKAVENFLKQKEIKIRNWILVNDMAVFISSIFNEINVTTQAYPLHLILDNQGNLLAYLFGAYHNIDSAAPLLNFVSKLQPQNG